MGYATAPTPVDRDRVGAATASGLELMHGLHRLSGPVLQQQPFNALELAQVVAHQSQPLAAGMGGNV